MPTLLMEKDVFMEPLQIKSGDTDTFPQNALLSTEHLSPLFWDQLKMSFNFRFFFYCFRSGQVILVTPLKVKGTPEV